MVPLADPGAGRRVAAWALELLETVPAVVRAHGPDSPLDGRARVRVAAAVAAAMPAPTGAWVQASWAELLGDVAGDDVDDALGELARAAVRARRPVTGDDVPAGVPPPTLAAARGVIALAVAAGEAERAAARTIARLRRRHPLVGRGGVLATAADAAVGAAAVPVGAAAVAAAVGARVLARGAPALPPVTGPPPDEAGLLAAVLVQAIPDYLAGALPRLVLAALPVPVAIGVRAGQARATVRVGAGRIEVSDGIAGDVVAVVEGDAEPLLAIAAGTVARELATLPVRR